MITYVLIALLHGSANEHGVSLTDTIAVQEFTSKANCVAAGEFLMASHEELYEANSARYNCLPR